MPMTSIKSMNNTEQCVQSIPLDLDIYTNIISDSERLKSIWNTFDQVDPRFKFITADLILHCSKRMFNYIRLLN